MQAPGWTQGITFKAMGVGVLAMLMLIPLLQVQGLIGERQGLESEARQNISERWGGSQIVGGPVLVVPVRRQVQSDKGWISRDQLRYVLPEKLEIKGNLATEVRQYGIYATPIYTATIGLSGRFRSEDIAALSRNGGEPQWTQAVLRVPVADVRGIRSLSALKIDATDVAFGPGGEGIGGITATEVAWPVDPESRLAAHEFAFDMRLAGTAALSFLPLARQTDVTVSGAWPDPSFAGAFLPESHAESSGEFTAHWQVLDLNRSYGQQGAVEEFSNYALQQSAFGVELFQPVRTYQRNERAGKYGILFIALSFVALFLFEALGRWRVHPVQYLMVGLALSTFYVVLLALSEQIGFAWAYAIAAIAVVGIIAGYAAAAARSRSAGGTLGALLALVYGLLYGLVISEQHSLLMGAIALLAAIAALMYLTRRIDWYGIGQSQR
ncbi:MAG TPA: cell envelope integrity protein CreD [Dokdonella sp.]|uniref:cell envelope integrity protein CreD n=1 Tax=Dokdonella sp. TaxID=2291710 RepID=UPI002D7FEA92|nr:cell envelope integrity protein CreD [Dokdonella sp.]HET9033449.1 cell envelope integrity protein CreD [Dokdonella sp.]